MVRRPIRAKLSAMSSGITPTEQPIDEGAPTLERTAYVAPTLTFVGSVADLVQGGGGKLSTVGSDSGDIRKPPGKG